MYTATDPHRTYPYNHGRKAQDRRGASTNPIERPNPNPKQVRGKQTTTSQPRQIHRGFDRRGIFDSVVLAVETGGEDCRDEDELGRGASGTRGLTLTRFGASAMLWHSHVSSVPNKPSLTSSAAGNTAYRSNSDDGEVTVHVGALLFISCRTFASPFFVFVDSSHFRPSISASRTLIRRERPSAAEARSLSWRSRSRIASSNVSYLRSQWSPSSTTPFLNSSKFS